jgi:hypothetical protein
MDITKAVIYLNGQWLTTVESVSLARLVADEAEDGATLEHLRQLLYGTFSEIHEDEDIEVVFPELESL